MVGTEILSKIWRANFVSLVFEKKNSLNTKKNDRKSERRMCGLQNSYLPGECGNQSDGNGIRGEKVDFILI